jgi:hypothetical protein
MYIPPVYPQIAEFAKSVSVTILLKKLTCSTLHSDG